MTLQQYVASWHARVMTQIMNKAYKVTHERLSLSLFTLWATYTGATPSLVTSAFNPNPRPCTPAFPSELNSNIPLFRASLPKCQTKPGSLSEVPLTSHTSLSQCLSPLQLYSWPLFRGPCLPCPLFYPPASLTMPSTKQRWQGRELLNIC